MVFFSLFVSVGFICFLGLGAIVVELGFCLFYSESNLKFSWLGEEEFVGGSREEEVRDQHIIYICFNSETKKEISITQREEKVNKIICNYWHRVQIKMQIKINAKIKSKVHFKSLYYKNFYRITW